MYQQLPFVTVSREARNHSSYSPALNANTGELPGWQYANLLTGEGLKKALESVDTVIHLASGPGKHQQHPVEIVMARELLKAAKETGVTHFIYMSIVGVDRIPLPYYQAKCHVEEMIKDSGLPFTILRATQFHEFIDFQIKQLLKWFVAFVPGHLMFQPIAVDAVAFKLVQLAQQSPTFNTIEVGGSKTYRLREMEALWQHVHQQHKKIIHLPAVGAVMKALAKDYAVSAHPDLTSATWEEYLLEKLETNSSESYVHAVTRAAQ